MRVLGGVNTDALNELRQRFRNKNSRLTKRQREYAVEISQNFVATEYGILPIRRFLNLWNQKGTKFGVELPLLTVPDIDWSWGGKRYFAWVHTSRGDAVGKVVIRWEWEGRAGWHCMVVIPGFLFKPQYEQIMEPVMELSKQGNFKGEQLKRAVEIMELIQAKEVPSNIRY